MAWEAKENSLLIMKRLFDTVWELLAFTSSFGD